MGCLCVMTLPVSEHNAFTGTLTVMTAQCACANGLPMALSAEFNAVVTLWNEAYWELCLSF